MTIISRYWGCSKFWTLGAFGVLIANWCLQYLTNVLAHDQSGLLLFGFTGPRGKKKGKLYKFDKGFK